MHSPMHSSIFPVIYLNEFSKATRIVVVNCLCIAESLQKNKRNKTDINITRNISANSLYDTRLAPFYVSLKAFHF